MVDESCRMEPELSSKNRTNRAIGKTKEKMGRDDVNEFLKLVEDETENFTESSSQINKTWINTTKDRGRWTLLEEQYTRTSEERQGKIMARTSLRRNSESRPARYVNGVRLSDEESNQHHNNKSLKKTKVKSEMMIVKDAAAPQSVPHASPK